jgi:adenylate cyclase
MPKKADHIRYAKGFPALSYVMMQIVFWIFAYAFLAALSHLLLMTVIPLWEGKVYLEANLIIALFLGFFNGIATGLADRFFERRLFYNKSLGIIFFGKTIIYFIVFVILISFVRYAFYPYLVLKFFNDANPANFQRSWDYFFYFLLVYNIMAGLVISFINQVSKKVGPGILLPLLLGKYRTPKEEERIFLFMDLKASTSIAETLGHLKYSAFVRDSFMDVDAMIFRFNAQVYQYVGDEIVLTWAIRKDSPTLACIEFFFACESRFKKRTPYYLRKYGQAPQFKAGLHMGTVTAVEVGEIKRDIAYHGDTLNTASRIQNLCNEYDRQFLSSMDFLNNSGADKYYHIESLGMVELKGKSQAMEIAAIKVQRRHE